MPDAVSVSGRVRNLNACGHVNKVPLPVSDQWLTLFFKHDIYTKCVNFRQGVNSEH